MYIPGDKQNFMGQVPGTSTVNSNQFEFFGQVAGTKFWSLCLYFLVKNGCSQEGTWSLGVAD